jgi:hypothetical protein
MYFFVAESMMEESRQTFGILGLLSEFGGMQGLLVIFVTFILEIFNDAQLVSKSIRNLYFRKTTKKSPKSFDPDFIKTIKFDFKDKLDEYGYCCCFVPKKKSKTGVVFERGEQRMRNDMNIFKMIQTIKKLKASVKGII